MTHQRLQVRLFPKWTDHSKNNPSGPPTFLRTESENPGLLRISIYAEYRQGAIPNPTGEQLIDLAKGHGERQKAGELIETSSGTCVLGVFGTAIFRSEKWPHAQLWYLSNGRDFVLATLLCTSVPDPVEIGEAHGIVLGVSLSAEAPRPKVEGALGKEKGKEKRTGRTGLDSEAHDEHPTRLLAYCCLMPNHWHFVIWPERVGELTAFMQWLTHTHTMRWHIHYHTLGSGHLYQGRFKSFPVAEDAHFYTVVRYVERNALRANLVNRTENWRWSSLWRRQHPGAQPVIPLADWPLPMPADWLEPVNRPETEAELTALRQSVNRGAPFGNPNWQEEIARRYNFEYTLRPCGRPKKKSE